MAQDNEPPEGLAEYLNASPSSVVASAAPASMASANEPPPGLAEFVAPELKEEKYGTTSEMLKTAAESAASAATFGLSKGFERALGVKPEDIAAREEVNPGSAMAGSVAGLIGSTALGGLGAANIIEQTGVRAAEMAGLGRIGSAAIKGAVENAIFQGGNEVGKMMLGDPGQTVGTAAANVGLAGLIGAPFAVAGEGVKSLWAATVGKKVGQALDSAAAEATGATPEVTSSAISQYQPIKQFNPVSAEDFVKAKTFNKRPQFLSPSTAEDLANHKLFMSDDGVGYAISPEGDLQQVFNNSGKKGAGKDAIIHAISKGAKTLDAFDGYLPEYYNKFGFQVKNAIPWNEEYAPQGWNYEKYGRPNVVFMEYPENLSREPGRIAARHEAVGAELSSTTSSAQGIKGNLGIPKNDSLINWSQRGEISQGPQGASFGSTESNLQPLVQEGLSSLKPNVDQLKESASRLGVELTPGTVSESHLIQHMEGNLARRPSFAGVKLGQEQDAIFGKLEENAKQVLRDQTVKSEAQVGKEIKQGIQDKLESVLEPIEKEYKQLEPHFKNIEISDELKQSATNTILNHDYAKLDPEMGKLAQKVASKIENIKNVNDLKTVRTFIADDLSKAYRSGGPETRILQTAKDALTDMRASALTDAAEKQLAPADVLGRIEQADTAYTAYKKGLKSLGVETGTGTLNNARALLDRFGKISDENFANRFFDINDINSLRYLKEHFPEQFDLARRLKLKDIFENSLSEAQGKNQKFDVGRFLRQLSDKKMGPEAREMLLDGKNLEKLQDIKNIFGAIPGNPNPSGTSYSMAFANMFSPSGAMQNLTDTAQYAMLKALPHLQEAMVHTGDTEASKLAALNFLRHTDKPIDAGAFKSMVEYIHNTIKGESLLSKGVKAIFDESLVALPSHLIPDDKKLKKLDERLKDLQVNSQDLLKSGDVAGGYMQDHAMEIARTAGESVNYLNSLRPNEEKQNPLDSDPVVNQVAKAEYENALLLAQSPLMVLPKVKAGTVTSLDVAHIQRMYPGLYNRLGQKMNNEMINRIHKGYNVPYKTRMGVSMFLAHPLDSTMTPASIQAAQPKMAAPMPMQNMPRQTGPHSMKNIGKIATGAMTPSQARQASRATRH